MGNIKWTVITLEPQQPRKCKETAPEWTTFVISDKVVEIDDNILHFTRQ